MAQVLPVEITEELKQSFINYAMSVIVDRALPDVRDGLKPVQRRILFGAYQEGVLPGRKHVKSAKIVGEVMGKYHPHGDAAIYDALVRMAQPWNLRYPLIDGQGNFGSIDGDPPAAQRYTEARLSPIGAEMLLDIDKDTVDFRPNYDGSLKEPEVLPAAIPNLLVNGASGIAVGMATSLPPHNLSEVVDALVAMIENPAITLEEVMRHLPGPDFPTGGIILGSSQLNQAYETGRGGFRVRAKWEVEKGKAGSWVIIITEIPYQVQKARLIEQIAQLLEEKKLPLLADLRDESTEQVRIVLEPKTRNVEPAVLMETLFRATALESRFPLNMNVLDANRTPRVMSLKEVLRAWLDHRHEVLQRRTNHRLGAIARRLEILDGYLIAYLNLDEVIRIIREEDEPKPRLMERFGLNDTQTEAILNMRLRALRRLEEMEIRKEHKKLSAEQKKLQALMKSEAARWQTIGEEIESMRTRFGDGALGARRTATGAALPEVVVDEAAFVEREPITVILSEKGWIRAQKGHVSLDGELRFKEGDSLSIALHAETTDRLVLFATNGKAFTLKADAIPRGRGDGQPVRLMLDLTNEDAVVTMFVHREGLRYLVAASDGKGFLVKGEELLAEKRTGKQVLNVDPPTEAAVCVPAEGDSIAVIGDNRKLLLFPLDQVPEMTRGRGVQLQSYRDGGLADAKVFTRKEGLSWVLGERTRVETDLRAWVGNRAGAGKAPPNGFPRSNRFE